MDNLYVNLTAAQQDALDLLDKAFDACMDANVKHTDVKDTANVWLARIQSVEAIKANKSARNRK